MAKYHINNETGNIGVCKATKGNCPLGGDENHFTSMSGAAKAYEERMASQTPPPVQTKRKEYHRVEWEDLTQDEQRLISRQDTALRDTYFEVREVSSKLTHEHVWPVVKEWDDHMMGEYGDQADVLDSYYLEEGNLGSKGYTNTYDAKVRWLKRVAGATYPLLSEIPE